MEYDLYKILQVSRDADSKTIESSYRRLAQKYHPDVNPNPDADERMKALNAAYAILKDPTRRAEYDARRWGARIETPPHTYTKTNARTTYDSYTSPPKYKPTPSRKAFDAPSPGRTAIHALGRILLFLFLASSSWRSCASVFNSIKDQPSARAMPTIVYTYLADKTATAQYKAAHATPNRTAMSRLATPQAAPNVVFAFPMGTPQAVTVRYLCSDSRQQLWTWRDGQFIQTGEYIERGVSLNIYGRIRGYYFVGMDENARPNYVPENVVCIPTPTALKF